MRLIPDRELHTEFRRSDETSYITFLHRSLDIQYDILADEPRERDLTAKYIAVLERELLKFTEHACEVCPENGVGTRYDEHNGPQWFCEQHLQKGEGGTQVG